MNNNFSRFLEKSKSVLILLPLKPDLDAVASGLSLYLALREEIDTQIYSPNPMTVEFNRLVGVNKISQELGNRNLAIEFSDYKATDIERVSYDINDGHFKLTVIPKQKISPPQKESVRLSYTGINTDTVVAIGGVDGTNFPSISDSELSQATVAHIGNKDISFSSGKTYVSFSKPASSVSEVVYGLIKESGLKVDEDIATNLISGIENTTNNLSDTSVNAGTFSVMSDLLRAGGKRSATLPVSEMSIGKSVDVFSGGPNQDQKNIRFAKTFDKKQDGFNSQPSDWLTPGIRKGSTS